MTNHLLVDNPNRVTPQGGWPRRGVAAPSGTCIVHTSEGPWQNGVNALTQFIRTRADYGSYHRACDWADIAVYYPWEWEAWQDSETNPWAVGIAAACRTSDWAIMPADIREGYYRNMGRMAADFVAYMRDTHGVHVPLRRITGAQARARVPGFCAHGDSGVARSDPGADFDWGYFFKCTQEALGAGSISPASGNITPAPKPAPALDDWTKLMSDLNFKDRSELRKFIEDAVWDAQLPKRATKNTVSAEMRIVGTDQVANGTLKQIQGLTATVAGLRAVIASGSNLTEAQIESAVDKALGSYELGLVKKEQ